MNIGRRGRGRYKPSLLNSQWLFVGFYQLACNLGDVLVAISPQPGLDISFHLISMEDVNKVCVRDPKRRIKTEVNISEVSLR
jgi:hypothetical protein